MENAVSKCSLPSEEVKQFLLEVLDHTTFKGSLVEFVSAVKQLIKDADIK
jgi:hypothetical protein